MISQGRVPEEGETFELLFQKAYPGRPPRAAAGRGGAGGGTARS